MRLTSALIEQAVNQLEAEAIPEGHPALPQLKGLFGDHTFFLDGNGLSIVEPADSREEGVVAGEVVSLADWNNEDPPSLARHAPEPTNVVIILGSKH